MESGSVQDSKQTATSIEERLKSATEGLKKLLDSITPKIEAEEGKSDEDKPTSPPPVIDELYGAIGSADVDSFRGKWVRRQSATERPCGG